MEVTDKDLLAVHKKNQQKVSTKTLIPRTTAKVPDRFCDAHKVKMKSIGRDPYILWRCPECSREKFQDFKKAYVVKTDKDEARRLEHRENLLYNSDIPKRYQDEVFTTKTPQQIKANVLAGKILTTVDTAMFIGKLKTGKTLLACNIIKDFITKGLGSAKYSVFFDIIGEIKDSWGFSDIQTMGIINRYVEPDLLVIDEVGLGYGSETELIYISRIIDRRYNDMKKTILCGNVSPEEIETIIGDKAYRRIEDNCVKVVFNWERHTE